MTDQSWNCIICGKTLDPSETMQFLPNHLACLCHTAAELDKALEQIKFKQALDKKGWSTVMIKPKRPTPPTVLPNYSVSTLRKIIEEGRYEEFNITPANALDNIQAWAQYGRNMSIYAQKLDLYFARLGKSTRLKG